MKIIDLIIAIANKEKVPYKIKYDGKEMVYDGNKQDYLGYYSNGNGEWLFQYLFDRCKNTSHFINDYVQVIEEDKGEIKEDTFNGLKWFADGKCFLSLSSEPLKTKDIEADNEIKKWDYDADCIEEWTFREIKEKLDELVDAVNELRKGK